MRRASRILLLIGTLLALSALAASAQNRPQIVTSVDGIGMLDYTRKPTFQVGDWVKYRMSGSSDYLRTQALSREPGGCRFSYRVPGCVPPPNTAWTVARARTC